MFARQNSRVILAHLLRWQGFGICQYAGTFAALHLHQTDAMQNSGKSLFWRKSAGIELPAVMRETGAWLKDQPAAQHCRQ